MGGIFPVLCSHFTLPDTAASLLTLHCPGRVPVDRNMNGGGVHTHVQGKVLDPGEIKWQGAVSCLKWVLEIKLWSSGRTARLLAAEPSLAYELFFFL